MNEAGFSYEETAQKGGCGKPGVAQTVILP